MTRRTCRGGHSIQGVQDVRADSAAESDIQRVRQTLHRMAIEDHAITELFRQQAPEVVAQFSDGLRTQQRLREFARGAEADIEQDVLGAGATARFMTSTMDKRLDLNARAYVESADPLGAVKLVAR